MCKHDELQINDIYNGTVKDVICHNCNQITISLEFYMTKYLGHIRRDDLIGGHFHILSPKLICSECGTHIKFFLDPCGGGNYYVLDEIKQDVNVEL